ncbi:hypothetical protein NDU88_010784 [Pleurodeles waltl]|uniref:Uncharacterized protein n=1 Tax=Pleurodeles waltl TaxID=8319 RepID=A0AAV7S4E2_PLEWA|nr:hypothetical protein NDU88_010784 [Pleurodeles waltl]
MLCLRTALVRNQGTWLLPALPSAPTPGPIRHLSRSIQHLRSFKNARYQSPVLSNRVYTQPLLPLPAALSEIRLHQAFPKPSFSADDSRPLGICTTSAFNHTCNYRASRSQQGTPSIGHVRCDSEHACLRSQCSHRCTGDAGATLLKDRPLSTITPHNALHTKTVPKAPNI